MNEKLETIACPVCGAVRYRKFLQVPDRFQPQVLFDLVRCADCGFVFLNPRPSEDAIPAYYRAEEYDPHRTGAQSLFDRLYDLIQRLNLRLKVHWLRQFVPAGNILDIGCGTGNFLLAVQKAGYRAQGMEPGEKARAHARVLGLRVAASLEEIDGRFDILTLWHVLEHVHNLPVLFRHIRRLLRSGGWLFVAVPNRNALDAKIFGRFWVAWDAPRHLYHFRPADLDRLILRHGFRLHRRTFLPFDPFYNALLSGQLRRKILGKAAPLASFKDFAAGLQAFWLGAGRLEFASSPVSVYRKA